MNDKAISIRDTISWKVYAIVLLAVASGIVFRLIFPFDIEYKADEQWTFEHVQAILGGAPWPMVGMNTSFGPPNPGLSLWFFVGLGWLSGAATPPALSQAVQLLNVAALLAFLVFIFSCVSKDRREYWLWGAALWALNPVEIAYERKIWAQSVLPIFSVAFIAAWWHRRYFWAALLWGLVGALMAQVHIGAGFFALAVAGWTAAYNWRSVNWTGWFIGSILGALPSIPWLLQLHGHVDQFIRLMPPVPLYFLFWVSQSVGLFGAGFTPHEYLQFLSGPIVGGIPTFAVLIVHLVLLWVWVRICLRALENIRKQGWPARKLLLGESSEWLLIHASVWGYGGILTLLTIMYVRYAPHYLIVAAPIMELWVAMVVSDWVVLGDRHRFRKLMTVICVCELLTSAAFLSFVHQTQTIQGEYGPTWRSQQK
jgi:hypothetical protein